MSKNEQNNGPDANTGTNNLKFVGVAFQMLAIIGIFTFAGYKIDESTNHATKWVTAVLALTGVFIALFIVIRSLKN
jgi:hypothetical protein